MAKITDIGVSGIAGGIIHPMLKNKWRIDSISTLTEDELNMITLQAISLNYKFSANSDAAKFGFHFPASHDLKLVVEEAVNNTIAPIASKLMSAPFDLSFVHLDGDTSVLKTTTFKNCTGVGYDYDMNYAASESCKYPLKFKCTDIIYS